MMRRLDGSNSSGHAPTVGDGSCTKVTTLRATTDGAIVVNEDCTTEHIPITADENGDPQVDASGRMIEVVESFPKVKTLKLDKNRISKIADTTTDSVNVLNLANNNLKDLAGLTIPKSIYKLTLDGNAFNTVDAKWFPSRLTELSMKSNAFKSLTSVNFPDTLEKLDLTLNPLPLIENFAMPSQLDSFTCKNCGTSTFRGVKFSSKLRTFDMTQNQLTKYEVANSTVSILQRLDTYSVDAYLDKCADGKMVSFRSTKVCVIDDSLFTSKYKLSATDGATAPMDSPGTNANSASAAASSGKWMTIAMASGGALVFVILSIVGVLLYRRRKARQHHFQDKLDLENDGHGPSTTGPTKYIQGTTSTLTGGSTRTAGATQLSNSMANSRIDSFPNDVRTDDALQPFVLLPSDVVRGKLIARGGYGAVYMASFRGETVVIKQMLPDKTRNKQIIKSFMDEIRICAQLDHPKVVKFLGITWTTLQDLSVVLEYMPNGDLSGLLHEQHQREKTFPGPKGARTGFGWFHSNARLKCKSLIALDIAEALVYLHSFESPIIHRDLKPKNVLMSSSWEAKLTDFGISREKDEDLTMTAEIGTVAWIAPEVLKGERYSEMADVYSFGVILAELDTCRRPFSNSHEEGGFSNTRIAVLVSSGQLKPSLHRDCPRSVRALIKRCLAFRPEDRPTAIQIHYELRNLELSEDEMQDSEIAVLGGTALDLDKSTAKGKGSRFKGGSSKFNRTGPGKPKHSRDSTLSRTR